MQTSKIFVIVYYGLVLNFRTAVNNCMRTELVTYRTLPGKLGIDNKSWKCIFYFITTAAVTLETLLLPFLPS